MTISDVNTNKAPKLRFSDFAGEWHCRKIKDIGEVITGSTPPTIDRSLYGHEYDFITPGDIKRSRFVTRTMIKLSSKGFSRARQINPGSILFVSIGSIGRLAQTTKIATTNQQINSVLVGQSNVDSFVYYALLKNSGRISKLAGIQVMPLLNKSDFSNIKIFVPNKEEQQKIADFLGAVDEKIEKQQRKKELLEKYKKCMMQKIFSQELRFKDENGKDFPEWEEKKLGDVFEECIGRGGGVKDMLSVTINNGIVLFSDIDRKDNSSADKSNYKRVDIGDIAYNSMRMWQGASGVSKYTGIVSPAYTVIRPLKGNNSEFWGYYFKLPKVIFTFERYSQGLTSDTWNLKFAQLSQIQLPAPSEKEQAMIASILVALDDKIEIEGASLKQADYFREFLFQKMLV